MICGLGRKVSAYFPDAPLVEAKSNRALSRFRSVRLAPRILGRLGSRIAGVCAWPLGLIKAGTAGFGGPRLRATS